MPSQTDEARRRWFLWGVLLAWIPFLFLITPGIIGLIRVFGTSKVTGLAGVAGGLAEALSTFGLATTLVFEVAAIVLLLRAFSQARPMRAFFSVISICCGGLVLGLFLWLFLFRSFRVG
jgi:hypothetical protein